MHAKKGAGLLSTGPIQTREFPFCQAEPEDVEVADQAAVGVVTVPAVEVVTVPAVEVVAVPAEGAAQVVAAVSVAEAVAVDIAVAAVGTADLETAPELMATAAAGADVPVAAAVGVNVAAAAEKANVVAVAAGVDVAGEAADLATPADAAHGVKRGEGGTADSDDPASAPNVRRCDSSWMWVAIRPMIASSTSKSRRPKTFPSSARTAAKKTSTLSAG